AVGLELAPVGLDQVREGSVVAIAGGCEQLLIVHRHSLPCHSATSPPSGVETTLRHPDGPSRGSSRTLAPSPRARSVAAPIRSTATYGSHSGCLVSHSTTPPQIGPPIPRAR